MQGTILKIEGQNIVLSVTEKDGTTKDKTLFALPAVKQYMSGWMVGDILEYSTSKNDKGAMSFGKKIGTAKTDGAPAPAAAQKPTEEKKPAGPKEIFQADLSGATPETPEEIKKRWDAVYDRVKAMHPEDRIVWAGKILEDVSQPGSCIPDRIESLARLALREKTEGDKIAAQTGQPSDPAVQAAKTNATLQKPPEGAKEKEPAAKSKEAPPAAAPPKEVAKPIPPAKPAEAPRPVAPGQGKVEDLTGRAAGTGRPLSDVMEPKPYYTKTDLSIMRQTAVKAAVELVKGQPGTLMLCFAEQMELVLHTADKFNDYMQNGKEGLQNV
jgi:hypothetical protein